MRSATLIILLVCVAVDGASAQTDLPRFERTLHAQLVPIEAEVTNGSYGRALRAVRKLLKHKDAKLHEDARYVIRVIESFEAEVRKGMDKQLDLLSRPQKYAQLLAWKYQFEGLELGQRARTGITRMLANSEDRERLRLNDWRKQWRLFEKTLREEVQKGARATARKKVRAAYKSLVTEHGQSLPADCAKQRLAWMDDAESRAHRLRPRPRSGSNAKDTESAPPEKQPAKPKPLPAKLGPGLVFRLTFAGDAATLRALLRRDRAAAASTNHNLATPLHIAAQFRQVGTAKVLIEHGAQIDAKSGGGWTPLHSAAFHGATKIAHLLIAKKAQVNARQREKFTPLHFAAEQGHAEIVKSLVAAGADVNALTIGGYSPLHIAALNRQGACVGALLDAKARTDLRGMDGATPLFLALKNNDRECMTRLIWARSPLVKDPRLKFTALHQAAIGGYCDGIEAALEAGDKIDARAAGGMTALHYAVIHQHDVAVMFLLKKGANINATADDGATPLQMACRVGSLNTVTLLLIQSANTKLKDKFGHGAMRSAAVGNPQAGPFLHKYDTPHDDLAALGFTPLHTAVFVGDQELAEKALANGAQIEAVDRKGIRPLALAARCGNTKMMEFLIAKGADINLFRAGTDRARLMAVAMSAKGLEPLGFLIKHRDKLTKSGLANQTPMHFAARQGDEDKIRFLKKNGYEVDALSDIGTTPLFEALRSGQYEAARTLLSLGADAKWNSDRWGTPLMLLARHRKDPYGTAAMGMDLIRAGADVNAKTGMGSTALHAAALHGHIKLGSVLVLAGASATAENALHRTPLKEARGRRDRRFERMLEVYGR